jgi:hypothetical protein
LGNPERYFRYTFILQTDLVFLRFRCVSPASRPRNRNPSSPRAGPGTTRIRILLLPETSTRWAGRTLRSPVTLLPPTWTMLRILTMMLSSSRYFIRFF